MATQKLTKVERRKVHHISPGQVGEDTMQTQLVQRQEVSTKNSGLHGGGVVTRNVDVQFLEKGGRGTEVFGELEEVIREAI